MPKPAWTAEDRLRVGMRVRLVKGMWERGLYGRGNGQGEIVALRGDCVRVLLDGDGRWTEMHQQYVEPIDPTRCPTCGQPTPLLPSDGPPERET